MPHLQETYARGQLAKLTGVKSETIRYYEKCGLLDAPARSPGGHRIYTEENARQLTFIRRCRELGFTMKKIGELLYLAGTQKKTCEQVRLATAGHLDDVQNKIKDLRKMERTLRDLIGQCEVNYSSDCPIIDILSS